MIEFGAGGAIMHTEEPATTTEPQPAETAETPAAGDTASPAVAIGPAGEDVATPVAVTEGEVGNADSSAVDPSQVAVEPARDEEPVAPSAPAPSQAGPTTGAQPTPIGPQNAPPQQNPRRKRRPKGWSCPVCRQRKCSRILPSPARFFDPRADVLLEPPVSSSSLHIPAAHHDRPTHNRRRQGRQACLDVDHRPPTSRPSRFCHHANGHSRIRNDARGAHRARARAPLALVKAGVPPRTLTSHCRPRVARLTHDTPPSRDSLLCLLF